jgi:peroxiredoxin
MLALGECFSHTGKLIEARRRLETVIKAAPASLEAHRELAAVYTGLHLGPEAAVERASVNRLQQQEAASEAGPKVNELAPDFELADAAKKKVRLGDFRGKSPVVLVLGSYSCPNFRYSADALNGLYQHYRDQANFLLVYIREAHATDKWESSRNDREGIVVAPARTIEEKQDHAVLCSRKLHLQFPALVDGMDGGVEAAYAAWPTRAFVIAADGQILYSTRLTELDFRAEDMESALRNAISK